MIITITGKPCSGKGTTSKGFCKKYNFEYIGTGDMFREYAKQYGYDILSFQEQSDIVTKIDKQIDNQIFEIGKSRFSDNIVIDSRLAWHFIPNSFKVFIDIDDKTAAERLLGTTRETESATSIQEAIKKLKHRWNVENVRYQKLYNIDNLDLNNYDFVINSKNLTPEQIIEEIYKNYQKFIKNR
ncbi:MAG: nucleoside monophosphate kinase [Clostridia bacterium]|nr:nucleoside monophosphate kinase [Clostridia bacterium]